MVILYYNQTKGTPNGKQTHQTNSSSKLKEMEEQINYGGTGSFIRVKDVI